MFRTAFSLLAFVAITNAFTMQNTRLTPSRMNMMAGTGLPIDMTGEISHNWKRASLIIQFIDINLMLIVTGKTVFIGGVADSSGYGWAIARACALAGAKV